MNATGKQWKWRSFKKWTCSSLLLNIFFLLSLSLFVSYQATAEFPELHGTSCVLFHSHQYTVIRMLLVCPKQNSSLFSVSFTGLRKVPINVTLFGVLVGILLNARWYLDAMWMLVSVAVFTVLTVATSRLNKDDHVNFNCSSWTIYDPQLHTCKCGSNLHNVVTCYHRAEGFE